MKAFTLPRGVSRRASAMAMVFALALTAHSGAVAQAGPRVMVADKTGTATVAHAQALRARASEHGTIRVIIGLDTDFHLHGSLNGAQIEAQGRGITAAQNRVLSQLSGHASATRYRTIPYMAVTVNMADLQTVLSMPGVTSVQEDMHFAPYLSDTTALVDARRLWAQGIAGSGQSIAVLDSGTWPNHFAFYTPQFDRKIPASACFSTNDPAVSATSTCPNGQDVQIAPFGPVAGFDCDPAVAGCGHGTHVAAIAGGRLNTPPMSHGMARDADIVPINVFRRLDGFLNCFPNSSPCIRASFADLISGLEQAFIWRTRNNIAAVNMSLGGGQHFDYCDNLMPAMTAVIDNLRSVGVATVIASGNNGFNGSTGAPACISSAINVGSTTKTDTLSSFSNHASFVDLLAPGSDVVAADSSGTQTPPRRAQVSLSGTSMAAPHVAGAFAMLRAHQPTARVTDIERALACTGVPVSRVSLPKPRISMARARNYLNRPDGLRGWGFGAQAQAEAWRPILGEREWTGASGPTGNSLLLNSTGSAEWSIAQAPYCVNDVVLVAQMARADPDPARAWYSGLLISSMVDDDGLFSGLFFGYAISDSATPVRIEGIESASGVTGRRQSEVLCSNSLPPLTTAAPQVLQVVKQRNELVFRMNGAEVCRTQTNPRFRHGHVKLVMEAPRGDAAVGHSLRLARMLARPLIQRDPIAGQSVALAGAADWPVTAGDVPD
ncbi:MAG: S8 family serine peptidase [Rhodobacteraceae bacterium]|nr:S8 family serine peptidase [Paracoccaceae bacterium]TVR43582.1 MAG: hypothetical protein EA386_15595 [Paracoccaceae bacterium]